MRANQFTPTVKPKKNRSCSICGKQLPAEGALRKDRKTGKILAVHFECAKDKRLIGVFQ